MRVMFQNCDDLTDTIDFNELYTRYHDCGSNGDDMGEMYLDLCGLCDYIKGACYGDQPTPEYRVLILPD